MDHNIDHADQRELSYLEDYGALVEQRMDALTLHLPCVIPWLASCVSVVNWWFILSFPLFMLGALLPPLTPIVEPLFIANVAMVVLVFAVLTIKLVLEALTPLKRTMFTEMVVSAHVLRCGDHVIPLESISSLEVVSRLGYWQLVCTTDSNTPTVLVEMRNQTPLDRLVVLLRRHTDARRASLKAAGLDPTGRPPLALEALRKQ